MCECRTYAYVSNAPVQVKAINSDADCRATLREGGEEFNIREEI